MYSTLVVSKLVASLTGSADPFSLLGYLQTMPRRSCHRQLIKHQTRHSALWFIMCVPSWAVITSSCIYCLESSQKHVFLKTYPPSAQKMTFVLTRSSIFSHCPSAVRSAPSRLLVPFYWLLGFLTGVSFYVGTRFPVKTPRKSGNEILASSSTMSSTSGLVVVIPAFIMSTLEAKLLQSAVDVISRSKTFIIVVDDSSPFRFSLRSHANMIVVRHESNLGPAGARNTGINKALQMGASSIAFTDSDCLPTPQWAVIHAQLQQECPGLWAGRTVAQTSDMISVFHERTGTLSPFVSDKGVLYAPTCNLSVSRVVASELLFDTSFPSAAFEDVTYCCRARELGHEIKLCSKAVVKHNFNGSVTGLAKQFWKYGRAFPLACAKDPDLGYWLSRSYPVWSARHEHGKADHRKMCCVYYNMNEEGNTDYCKVVDRLEGAWTWNHTAARQKVNACTRTLAEFSNIGRFLAHGIVWCAAQVRYRRHTWRKFLNLPSVSIWFEEYFFFFFELNGLVFEDNTVLVCSGKQGMQTFSPNNVTVLSFIYPFPKIMIFRIEFVLQLAVGGLERVSLTLNMCEVSLPENYC